MYVLFAIDNTIPSIMQNLFDYLFICW